MNVNKLQKTIQKHLSQLDTAKLESKMDIDNFKILIVKAAQARIDTSTPWFNPFLHSITGFDGNCKNVCIKVQQLQQQ
jgi:hypothetical protein